MQGKCMMTMSKCINEKDSCFCNKLRECEKCDGNNIKDNKCILTKSDFCTCRLCGKAVRSDGYKYSEK